MPHKMMKADRGGSSYEDSVIFVLNQAGEWPSTLSGELSWAYASADFMNMKLLSSKEKKKYIRSFVNLAKKARFFESLGLDVFSYSQPFNADQVKVLSDGLIESGGRVFRVYTPDGVPMFVTTRVGLFGLFVYLVHNTAELKIKFDESSSAWAWIGKAERMVRGGD